MASKSLAVAVLVAGCVAAAAGGAYMAVRHNAADSQAAVVSTAPPTTQPAETARPVAETEAVVSSDAAQKPATSGAESAAVTTPERPASETTKPADAVNVERETPRVVETPRRRPAAKPVNKPSTTTAARDQVAPAPTAEREVTAPAPISAPARTQVAEVPASPAPPPAPQFEELVVPAASVIGLRVETPLSTERARLEDRVNARVTRDVMADGRVAVPAGAQAIGSVTLVERGGKIKERARLGVRFHTLVLADGTELPISTEAIYREGEPVAGESSRKIGGAAVGGAILGALIGGKKGAIVGATTGAAGGTAVVMAGDRNAATLPTGTIVTVKLASPTSVQVEKR
jgi:hypothetical protein